MQPLSDEQREMAVSALERANQIASRYARVFPEHADDLASSAAWGVIKAATTFEDGGVRWDNWSANQAKNECLRFLGRPDVKRQMAWDEHVAETMLARGDPEITDDMATMLKGLPDTLRTLCVKVYQEDTSIEDAAVSLGFSPKHGHKLHREAIKILRKRMSA